MRLFIATAVVCLCAAGCLDAQSARVSGQVTDSQRGVVRGCEVVLRNAGTAVEYRTVTTDSGSFLLPPVPPGTYEVGASAVGFAAARLTGLTLDVGASKVLELMLQPASVHEIVEVVDTPPQVSTDRADRSVVIDRAFVSSMPLNVRNPLQLINFSPAVTKGDDGLSGQNVTSQSRTNTWRINGAKGSTTDIAIDGATDTTAYYNQASGIPGVDAVQEYRVYTSAYAPEFGRTSGGTVAYALRSGGNDLHGSLFEYLRNSDLDANGFNANKAAQPIAAFRRNQFGGTLGGPVELPKLYRGRDRTFFFVSYEGLRDSNAGSFTGTMPTALERTGNFSQTRDANGNLIVIYDPSTTRLDPSAPAGTTRYIRTALPGNVIPSGSIDPIATKLLSYYPAPNQAGVGQSSTNNYFSSAPGTNNNDRVDARLDQRISDHQLLYAHLDWFSNHIIENDYYGNSLAAVMANDMIPGFNIMLHHTWSISPSLVFDHHFNWGHSESNRYEPVHVTPASLGFPANATPGMTAEMTPQLSMTRASSLGNSYPFEDNESSVWQYAGDLSWLKGHHTFKFGYDFRRYPVQLYDPQQLAINATSNFTGGPNPNSATAASGSGIADLLLGAAGVTSGYAPETRSHHYYAGFYAQDVARLTQRLTLTFGLRVNYEPTDVEDQNQLNYIDLASASPLAGKVPGFPNLVGGVGIPGLNGASRNLQNTRGAHLDPRIGMAYQLSSKTVIHTGFGIFHHPQAAWEQFPNALGTTRTSNSIAAQADNVTPLFNLGNPFPQGIPQPWGSSAGLAIALGQNIAGPLHTQDIPYQANWSFDVQRELPLKIVVTAAYVGNVGVHLMTPIQFNQIPDSALAQGSKLLSVVPNPFYGVITDPSSTLSLPTVQSAQLLRPFPQFLNVKAVNVGAGHSSYQAGQLTVEKRLSQGLAFLLGYTRSKAIDNVGEMTSVAGTRNGFQDNYCFACDRSRSDQNEPYSLRLATRYELPLGPGKSLLRSGPAALAFGGWSLGGFYTVDAGRPVAVTSPNNSNSLGGGTGMRPNATGQSAALAGGPQICDGCLYFNPAAFSQTPQFAFGNVSRYLPGVNNPTAANFDASIEKLTPFRERYGLVFRAEMFNATNHVVFAGPTNSVTSATFGKMILSQSNAPRQVQFSLRLRF
ncbi:MAG TPA: carboxypeptidase regulatory-like domain-containing protein [Bryobacteraceae bacterium]|nr:carboxypeptidase regulatory-like domain-containing protein [Bryobacteraceae bacterium]